MAEGIQLQVGVKALLKNNEGKYLLVRRNPEKYPEVGALWDIVGGRIDPGSSLMVNLRREIKEEVNLELPQNPRLIAAQDIMKIPGRHVVRLTFVGNIDGQPTLDNDHKEFGWFSLAEMRAMSDLDPFLAEVLTDPALQLN